MVEFAEVLRHELVGHFANKRSRSKLRSDIPDRNRQWTIAEAIDTAVERTLGG
jgi:hypothetical protein